MQCLDDAMAVQVYEGRLPPEQAEALRAHASTCADCARRLQAAADAAKTPGGDADEPGAPAASLARRGQTLGRYIVLDTLGEGGMGVVYAAYDPELDRRVALKLLQPRKSERGADAHSRLLREAQALAKLSHPNVVTIYDVGSLDGRVFIAMELIEGQSLKKWLRERPRSWREVLPVFIDAGRGLAAAHDAGLVHRDFKPDNVLLGTDGRVRVLDFGVARASERPESDGPPEVPSKAPIWDTDSGTGSGIHTSPGTESRSGPMLSVKLTQDGAMVGTPRYMSPEQLQHRPADARSDQFSFCVALYEALYGKRPFTQRYVVPRLMDILNGRVQPPPPGAKVPGWIHKAVLRGLSAEPSARFPTMGALLDVLSRDPRQALRRWLVAAASLLLVAGGAAAAQIVLTQRHSQLCQRATPRLAGIWDPARQQAIERAFTRAGPGYGPEAWALVKSALDRYTGDWLAMHQDACQATRLRGEQSEEVLALRMACLDRRLQEVSMLTDVLTQPDDALLQRAGQAAGTLTPLSECADVAALLAQVKPPSTPEARAKVDALRGRLARATALAESGNYKGALALAPYFVAEAKETAYPPVLAEALFVEARVRQASFENRDRAIEVAEQAVYLAHAAKHDEIAAKASIALVGLNSGKGDWTAAERWTRYARATLERMGGHPGLQAVLLDRIAVGFLYQNKLAEALANWEQALPLSRRYFGPEHYQNYVIETNLEYGLFMIGRWDEAARRLSDTIDRMSRTLGTHHPLLLAPLGNLACLQTNLGQLGEAEETIARAEPVARNFPEESESFGNYLGFHAQLALSQGHYARALAEFKQSQAIYEKVSGVEHRTTFSDITSIGETLGRMGKKDEALAKLLEAVAIGEKAVGKDHPELTQPLMVLSHLYVERGDFPRALALRERVARICDAGLGPQHPDTMMAHGAVAEAQAALGHAAEARQTLEELQPRLERTCGTRSAPVAENLLRLAAANLALREPGAAVTPAERAVRILEGLHKTDPNEIARARLSLARALEAAGRPAGEVERAAASTLEALSRAEVPDAGVRVELNRLLARPTRVGANR